MAEVILIIGVIIMLGIAAVAAGAGDFEPPRQ